MYSIPCKIRIKERISPQSHKTSSLLEQVTSSTQELTITVVRLKLNP